MTTNVHISKVGTLQFILITNEEPQTTLSHSLGQNNYALQWFSANLYFGRVEDRLWDGHLEIIQLLSVKDKFHGAESPGERILWWMKNLEKAASHQLQHRLVVEPLPKKHEVNGDHHPIVAWKKKKLNRLSTTKHISKLHSISQSCLDIAWYKLRASRRYSRNKQPVLLETLPLGPLARPSLPASTLWWSFLAVLPGCEPCHWEVPQWCSLPWQYAKAVYSKSRLEPLRGNYKK